MEYKSKHNNITKKLKKNYKKLNDVLKIFQECFWKKQWKTHKFKGVGVTPIKVVGIGHWILIVCFFYFVISWELKSHYGCPLNTILRGL